MIDEKDMINNIDEIDTFVFHKKIFEHISALDLEMQQKIVYEICRCGVGLESSTTDPVIMSLVNALKGGIESTKAAYMNKVNMSKGAGRKKKYSDEAIWRLASQGLSVLAIAEELQCSESTVRHSEGYKNRNNMEFVQNCNN